MSIINCVLLVHLVNKYIPTLRGFAFYRKSRCVTESRISNPIQLEFLEWLRLTMLRGWPKTGGCAFLKFIHTYFDNVLYAVRNPLVGFRELGLKRLYNSLTHHRIWQFKIFVCLVIFLCLGVQKYGCYSLLGCGLNWPTKLLLWMLLCWTICRHGQERIQMRFPFFVLHI